MRFTVSVTLLLLTSLPGLAATADEAEIASLAVQVDGNRALVSFTLEHAVDPAFLERVHSGLPTGFVYQLELLKDRKRWYDRPLEQIDLQVMAMYDAVSQEYLVNRKLGGKLVDSRMVADLDALERELTQIGDLPAFRLDGLPRTWRLLVRVRAETGSATVFSIIPTKLHTPWRESKKFRTHNDLPTS